MGNPGRWYPDNLFDRDELRRGTRIEMQEHGLDEDEAKDIAKDHLWNDMNSYRSSRKNPPQKYASVEQAATVSLDVLEEVKGARFRSLIAPSDLARFLIAIADVMPFYEDLVNKTEEIVEAARSRGAWRHGGKDGKVVSVRYPKYFDIEKILATAKKGQLPHLGDIYDKWLNDQIEEFVKGIPEALAVQWVIQNRFHGTSGYEREHLEDCFEHQDELEPDFSRTLLSYWVSGSFRDIDPDSQDPYYALDIS